MDNDDVLVIAAIEQRFKAAARPLSRKERRQLQADASVLIDEVRRLHKALPRCPECGPAVRMDEDGCCVTCGADTKYSW